jgi:hypothetical protein
VEGHCEFFLHWLDKKMPVIILTTWTDQSGLDFYDCEELINFLAQWLFAWWQTLFSFYIFVLLSRYLNMQLWRFPKWTSTNLRTNVFNKYVQIESWLCGVVVIVSSDGTENLGFQSRRGVRLLGIFTLQCSYLLLNLNNQCVYLSEINVKIKKMHCKY